MLKYQSVLILVILASPFLSTAQDTAGTGALVGTVRDQLTGGPVAGARACLPPPLARCGTTSAEGRFRLGELRPGPYTLEIRTLGLDQPFRATFQLTAGAETATTFEVPHTLSERQELTVTASALVPPAELKNSSQLLPASEVRDSAASLKDVGRFVQTLPGVVFGGSDFSNDIVVRGGSPLENLYIVDNVEIPNINHFANFASSGGPVGILNSELLSDLTFLSGGYPAPYANRLSSVLQVTQRDGNRERVAGQASVGFAGAGGVAEGPIGSKGSWLVSARRSFLDWFLNDIGFGGVPIYTNFQGKAVYDLNARNRVWLVSVGGRDTIVIRPDGSKEDQASNFNNVDFSGWRNAAGLNWQSTFGARGVGLLGFTHSRGVVTSRVTDLRLADALVSRQNSVEDEYALKYDATLIVGGSGKLQAGTALRWNQLDYDFGTPLGLESAFSTAPGRINPLDVRRDFGARQPSGYAQFTRPLGRRVNLTMGARADRYGYLEQTRVSPRAGLTVAVARGLSASVSWGRYFQQPFFVFLAAHPVNRGLIPMRADHWVAGLAWSARPGLRVTLEAYQKRYADYPVARDLPQVTLASAGDGTGPNAFLLPMASAGRGRARGVELYVEKKLSGRLQGQANLAVASARHAALDGVLRPGGFDSRVVFNASGVYRLSRTWQAALRYVYLSGRPFTPFDPELSRAQNRGVFDLTQVNGVRAASYQRIDWRVDKIWKTPTGDLNLYFGFQNALNRSNFLAKDWDFRAGREKDLTQMGLFPIIGLEWRLR